MRKLLLSAALAVSALIGTTGAGQAVSLGTISTTTSFAGATVNGTHAGAFSDIYTFTLANNPFLTAASVTIDALALAIPGLTVQLFSDQGAVGVGGGDVLLAQATGGTPGTTAQITPFGIGPGGNYFYLVNGGANPSGTTVYGGTISFILTPIPGALLLMGSALLGAAGFSRWRKRGSPAVA